MFICRKNLRMQDRASLEVAGMKRMPAWQKIFAVVLVTLPMSGCVEWARPGTDIRTRDADLANCKAYGYKNFAPDMVTSKTSDGHYVKGEKKCRTEADGTQSCKREKYYQEAEYSTQDLNSDARDALIDDCMYRRGYYEKQT